MCVCACVLNLTLPDTEHLSLQNIADVIHAVGKRVLFKREAGYIFYLLILRTVTQTTELHHALVQGYH